MRRIFELLILMSLSFTAHSQCATNQLILVDTTGNKIDSDPSKIVYVLNNGADTILLDQLYDSKFTSQGGLFPFDLDPITSAQSNSNTTAINSINSNNSGYCKQCTKNAVVIIDSIDVNDDGVKEVFLFREWSCYVSPPNPRPFGVGVQQQYYSQYEIWDVKAKKKMGKFLNKYNCTVAISTNVITSNGFEYDLTINKDGSVLLSNSSGTFNEFVLGDYRYDFKTETYEKE